MNLWSLRPSLPAQTWLPLGLATLAPLALAAVMLLLSRRKSRGIALVLAIRSAVLLGFGFAALATVATVAVVRTGLTELRQRRLADVRSLAQTIEKSPLGATGGEALLQLGLIRAKDPSVRFAAVGVDNCRSSCLISAPDEDFDGAELRRALIASWPGKPNTAYTVSIAGRPYLLVASTLRLSTSGRQTAVVGGFDATYLAEQAAQTAWIVVCLSYVLLVLVGWSSWRQLRNTLATRIHAITMQLRLGIADEAVATLHKDGHELRELADSVSNYIRQTLAQQRSNEDRYRRLIELAPDAVLICSDAGVRFANPAAIALAGVNRRLDLIGLPIDQFLDFDNGDPTLSSSDTGLKPARWRRVNGEFLYVEVAEVEYIDSGVTIRQYVVRDVTRRRAREAALAHRAEHDGLTGLVNRARFQARLGEMLSPHLPPVDPADGREAAVLFIDLDDFKPINDKYGHAAGDAVLVSVAARLREATRGTDLVARLGGDEFAVLIEVREANEVLTVAKRILRSLRQPIRFENNLLLVRASIGIANAPRNRAPEGSTSLVHGENAAAELLRAADAAMYVAKANGGDRYAQSGKLTESPDGETDVNFHAVA
jgi:diguanylate cyclase (GGDEF)-like protein/PAS domain S-box-containing protein